MYKEPKKLPPLQSFQLYTQSKNYLIAEITEYINRRHATLSRKL